MKKENDIELAQELESKSPPRIRKAVKLITADSISGYENQLLNALKIAIQKPSYWKTQSQIIRALGTTGSSNCIEYLRRLVCQNHSSTVLYRDLGFAICLLEDIPNNSIGFLESTFSSNNQLLVAGACSALLYFEHVPSEQQIESIVAAVVGMQKDEGQIITPRCYIAAVSYLWPSTHTVAFLKECKKSSWAGLREIAESSLQGRKSSFRLV